MTSFNSYTDIVFIVQIKIKENFPVLNIKDYYITNQNNLFG